MKIKERLTLVLLIMSLVTLAVTGIVSYTIAKRALTRQVLDQLQSVASIQENRLVAIIERNLERLALVSSRTQLRLSLESFVKNPQKESQDKMNRILRDAVTSITCIRKASVLNLEGEVVACTDSAEIGASWAHEECFLRGRTANRADQLHLDKDGNLDLHLSGPLRLNGTLLGVVLIDVDAQDIVSLVKDYTGLGKTGEALVGRLGPEGDGIFLTPLRFDKDAALRRRVSKEALESPAMQALLKHEGLFLETVDYRGEPVLAATRYIEAIGWGLAVKIDKSEAFEPITRLGHLLMFFVLVASALAVYVSLYLARSIARPIAKLAHVTDRIAQGDLEARVKPTSKDEIGNLGQTFNQMAESLKTDVARRERTEARAEHLNLTLRAIRNVNQLITQEKDRDKLIKGACENLTQNRGYHHAWIVLLDESRLLLTAAESGLGEHFPSFLEPIQRGELIKCGQTALEQSGILAIEDVGSICIGCPLFAPHRGQGVFVTRLEYEGKTYGVLGVSIPSQLASDEEERSLFTELAGDLGFALHNIEAEEERQWAEEALHKSEHRYRTLVENLPQKIFVKDRESRYVSCNENFASDLGISAEEFARKTDYDFFPKELADKYRADDKRIMASREIEELDEKYLQDGEERTVHTVKTPLRDDEGNVTGILGIFWDITERKRAEDRLRLSIQVLEVLSQRLEAQEIARSVLLLIQRAWGFEAVGLRFQEGEDFPFYETHGFPDDFLEVENTLCAVDQAGETVRDSDGHAYLECMCGNVISGRTDSSLPFFTEGGSFWTNCTSDLLASTTEEERQAHTRNYCNTWGYESMALIPLKSGEQPLGLLQLNDTRKDMFNLEMIRFFEGIGVSIGLAISGKRAQEELARHRAHLKELVKERTRELEETHEQLVRQERLAVLGQLAGGVGHELRNPLGSIKNAAYFLNMVLEVHDPEVGEALQILQKEVSRSEGIISSLLDFARPKRPALQMVEVNDLIQQSLSGISMPDNVKIETPLSESLPLIEADPDQLAMIFRNLILNSIQAMEGGGQLTVESKALDDNWIGISFIDNGHGMSQEDVARIFEPLFTTKAKGIGLGLALSRHVAEAHGGAIEVQSELGKGSIFTIRLPVKGGP